MTNQITVPVDSAGNILDNTGKIIGHIDVIVAKGAELVHAVDQGARDAAQAAPTALDKAAQEAVAQSYGTASVIDSLATHLGNAADNLATKIQQIVEHYGPGAAQLIHEIGRISAIQDVGKFLFTGTILAFGVINFFKAWAAMDKLTHASDSVIFQVVIFGLIAIGGLISFGLTFSLSAVYGIVSPEAFLILKMLHL